jgi:hypothetical protein
VAGDNRGVSEAVALAQRATELFNREFSEERMREARSGVPDDVRMLYVEEPVIVPMRAALEGTEYSGPTALEDLQAEMRESWTWLRIDIDAVRELDAEHVLQIGTLKGSGRESGAEATADVCWLVEIEGDRISTVRSFTSEREALEAART